MVWESSRSCWQVRLLAAYQILIVLNETSTSCTYQAKMDKQQFYVCNGAMTLTLPWNGSLLIKHGTTKGNDYADLLMSTKASESAPIRSSSLRGSLSNVQRFKGKEISSFRSLRERTKSIYNNINLSLQSSSIFETNTGNSATDVSTNGTYREALGNKVYSPTQGRPKWRDRNQGRLWAYLCMLCSLPKEVFTLEEYRWEMSHSSR